MSRMRHKGGIWIGLLYVLMKIPMFILAICAGSFHHDVWGFPELRAPPYSPYIGPSLILSEVTSTMAAIWTLGFGACACAVGNRHGRWYLCAGLFDATLVSGLLTAAYLQSTFLPTPLGKCWNADQWPSNATAPANLSIPTMFEVLSGNATYAPKSCSNLVTVWKIETAMAIMLSVTCLIAWFMAARKLCFSPRDPNPAPLGADIWVFLNIFIIPVVCIMEPLVLQIVQPLRYYLRYLEKKRLGRKADTEVAMAPYPKDVGYASGGEEVTVIHIATNLGFRTPQINGDRSRLEVVLSCHSPVLDSVAIGLHYSDMLNLLLVSRTLRDAISARSREALGMASCVNGTKSECWGCRKQICIDCKKMVNLKNPVTTQHLKTCELRCSKCFYKTCCNDELSKADLRPRPSVCAGNHSNWRAYNPILSRELCRECYLSDTGCILATRAKREAIELTQISEVSTKCGNCKRPVGKSGPKWWFCKSCNKECTKSYHSAWRQSEDVQILLR